MWRVGGKNTSLLQERKSCSLGWGCRHTFQQRITTSWHIQFPTARYLLILRSLLADLFIMVPGVNWSLSSRVAFRTETSQVLPAMQLIGSSIQVADGFLDSLLLEQGQAPELKGITRRGLWLWESMVVIEQGWWRVIFRLTSTSVTLPRYQPSSWLEKLVPFVQSRCGRASTSLLKMRTGWKQTSKNSRNVGFKLHLRSKLGAGRYFTSGIPPSTEKDRRGSLCWFLTSWSVLRVIFKTPLLMVPTCGFCARSNRFCSFAS